MFVKNIKAGNHTYVQIVESYKENGISKHRVLLNLGRIENIKGNKGFKRMIDSLYELMEINKLNIDDISSADILNYGYIAYKKLWDNFGLSSILNKKDICGNIDFSLNDTSFLMSLTHLLDPQSKLSVYNHKNRYFNLPNVKLHNLYRSLDILSKNKERIEEHLFYKKRDLFNLSLDVVFYDVTTFYFESVKKDSLKDFGFSKDNKLNEVQVVMGLLIDKEGLPVGYELFPGNTFEGKTLEASLEKLGKRFNIKRVIIVADKGMNSRMNLKKIHDMGFTYIISSRLKSFKKQMLNEIFSKDGYMREKNYSYKKIDCLNKNKGYEIKENLIVTYSDERALLDKKKREKLVKKAQEYTDKPSLIKASSKRGGKKYIKETGNCSFSLDEESISKDEALDGYYALQTNELGLSPKEIINAYHNLWKIEESFRIMKSTMEVRPVFHWTEKRIKGHFVVCFLSFLLERTLEFKLKEKTIGFSSEKIKEALNSLNFAKVELRDKQYLIKTKSPKLATDILTAFRIKHPKNITPLSEINIT